MMNAKLDPITLRKIALQILIVLGVLFGAVAWNQKPEAALLWLTGMIALALVLIVIGNGLPKKIEPGCSRTRGLAVQRLLGWTFVVTGLVAPVVWLTVPMAYAKTAGLSVYALAILFAVYAVVRIRSLDGTG